MAYRLFLVDFGYVESALLGQIPFRSHAEYSSVEEGLQALGQAVFDSLEEIRADHNHQVEKNLSRGLGLCCQTVRDTSSRLWCKCGTPIREAAVQTTAVKVIDTLSELLGKSNDETLDLWQRLADRGWELGTLGDFYGDTQKLVFVHNYCWHPDFDRFGNLATEWQVADLTGSNDLISNNKRNASSCMADVELDDSDDNC